jgi:HEAT repeat protein
MTLEGSVPLKPCARALALLADALASPGVDALKADRAAADALRELKSERVLASLIAALAWNPSRTSSFRWTTWVGMGDREEQVIDAAGAILVDLEAVEPLITAVSDTYCDKDGQGPTDWLVRTRVRTGCTET